MAKRKPMTLASLRQKKTKLHQKISYEGKANCADDGQFDDFTNESDVLNITEIECNIQYILRSSTRHPGISPVVTRSMLYSVMPNKTQVDSDLIALEEACKLKLFTFRSKTLEYIMLSNDYNLFLKAQLKDYNISADKIINVMKKFSNTISFSKAELKGNFCLSEDSITCLTQNKILSFNPDDMKYEFTLPCAGNYVELISKGRLDILNHLRHKSSNEILENELLSMKFRNCSLGVKYIIHDLIGSGKIQAIKCSMGNLLRLKP